MKLIISSISVIILFWSINLASPNNIKDRVYQPTNTVLEKNGNNDFKGLWINENDKTRGISKCQISFKNNSIVFQMCTTCHPQTCDWGKKESNEVK